MQEYRLKVSHVYKSFPGVQALKDINFAVRKGTVHVLCGENGAGKSTLMKIINGIYKADIGGIEIDGKPVQIKNPIQARKLGISMIFQELNYVPEMTVEESLFLGDWPLTSAKTINWKKIKSDVSNILKREGLNYSPTAKLKELTVSDVQMLEIIKSIQNNANIFIMDEPTRGIDVGAKFEIYKLMTDLVKEGKTLIVVSSELPELIGMCDRIYVMCKGSIAGMLNRDEFSQETIMKLATGTIIK